MPKKKKRKGPAIKLSHSPELNGHVKVIKKGKTLHVTVTPTRVPVGTPVIILGGAPYNSEGKPGVITGYHQDGYVVKHGSTKLDDLGNRQPCEIEVYCEKLRPQGPEDLPKQSQSPINEKKRCYDTSTNPT